MSPPSRWRSPGRLVFVGTFVLTLAVLLARNTWILTARVIGDSDYASNSLRIALAKQFRLLLGNYSRVGFQHPGPALLYVQAWSELIFRGPIDVVRTPYTAQVLGIVILNALLVAAALYVVWQHARRLVPLVLIGGGLLLVLAAEPGGAGQPTALLTNNWMPCAYVCPFFAFTVAAASVAAGRWRSTWLVVLTGGLLVHGHVSFVTFVPPVAVGLVVLWAWRWRRDHHVLDGARRTFVLSGALLALFLLPMVLDLVLHWPGQYPDYWHYAVSGDRTRPSLRASADYVFTFWWPHRPRRGLLLFVAVTAVALASTALVRRREVRAFSLSLVVMGAVMTLLFWDYAYRGIDTFDVRYVAYFYDTVPVVLGAAIAVNVGEWVGAAAWRAVGVPALGVGAAVVAVFAVRAPGLANPYRGDPSVPALTAALRDDPARAGRPIGLVFDAWGTGLAILDYGRRHHVPVCLPDPDIQAVPEATCGKGTDPWLVHVEELAPGTPPPAGALAVGTRAALLPVGATAPG